MKLKKERIAILSKSIVGGLIKNGLIATATELAGNELVNKIQNTITEELMVEDRLNGEVRQILKAHSKELEQNSVNYQRMFQMVKSKLVKERGIII